MRYEVGSVLECPLKFSLRVDQPWKTAKLMSVRSWRPTGSYVYCRLQENDCAFNPNLKTLLKGALRPTYAV